MSTLRHKLGPLFRGLWRNPEFVKLWTSLTITSFGAQITNLALPLTPACRLPVVVATNVGREIGRAHV